MTPDVFRRRFIDRGTAGVSSSDLATLIELFEAFCRWRYANHPDDRELAEQDMIALGNRLEGIP